MCNKFVVRFCSALLCFGTHAFRVVDVKKIAPINAYYITSDRHFLCFALKAANIPLERFHQ